MAVACKRVDPFTRLYQTITEILRDHRPLMELVKVGNLVSFSGQDEDPTMEISLDGDLPLLEIRTAGGEFGVNISSDKIGFTRIFTIGIVTPDKRATAYMLPIEWEIWRAFCLADGDMGIPKLIDSWQATPMTVSESDEANGWTALIELTIRMGIDKKELSKEEPELWL